MPSPEAQGLPHDAFASAAVGMAVICPESGRYLRVNPALCRMLRREEADLLGSSHEALTHEDDRPAYRERARALLAGEIDWWQVEKVVEAGDGEELWVRSSGSLIHDREGRPFFFTQYQDLSDRRRAEAALHHTDVRLHTAVANAPLVLFTLDREGRVTFLEGGGVSSLPPPLTQPGESVFDVYADQPEIESNTRRALAGETFATTVEVRGVAYDTRYAPLYDDRGEIVGVVGTAVDATERVTA
ncbi:MAG: PAS domain-containing protein, partial [Actinomycetota bacterium]|nr:PAS domain-containing protein [Actinomycetota bacterium]